MNKHVCSRILEAKHAKGVTWEALGKTVGMSEVWVVAQARW